MAKTSPTQRSLALLRKQGMTVAIVERWNAYTKTRQDLLGFADLLAIDPLNEKIILVQTTSRSNQSARCRKIFDSEHARTWLKSGGLIVVHGWAKQGPRGKRKVWGCTETPITAADFPSAEAVHDTELFACDAQ